MFSYVLTTILLAHKGRKKGWKSLFAYMFDLIIILKDYFSKQVHLMAKGLIMVHVFEKMTPNLMVAWSIEEFFLVHNSPSRKKKIGSYRTTQNWLSKI